jgi:hypothetical protein
VEEHRGYLQAVRTDHWRELTATRTAIADTTTTLPPPGVGNTTTGDATPPNVIVTAALLVGLRRRIRRFNRRRYGLSHVLKGAI